MADEQMRGNGFGKGMLIGSLFGAALALIYAPKSGADLRKDIRKRADGMKTTVNRYAQKIKKQTNGLISKRFGNGNTEQGTRRRKSRQHATTTN